MSELGTQAVQDYLKTIYDICSVHERATTGQIAEMLDVTPASVTGMLKKLAQTNPAMLEYRPHRGVVLTAAGERAALEVIRHHRLLECFLHEALGYSWDEVHDEADRLEHAVTDTFSARIAKWLQEPQHDPHGAPIPTADLRLPPSKTVQLSELEPGPKATVIHVYDRDPALLRYLADVELTPQTDLTVLPPLPFSDHVRVQLCTGGEPIIISHSVARRIHVALHDRSDDESNGEQHKQ